MKVEMAVLGSPSPRVRTVSVDVKQHVKKRDCSVCYTADRLWRRVGSRRAGINQLTATTTTTTTTTTKTVNQLTATVNQLTATTITKTINPCRCLLKKHIHPNNSGTNDTVGKSGVILFYWCINLAYFISSILVSLSVYFWQFIIFTSLFLVGHYRYQFISGSSLSLSVHFW